IGRLAAGKPSLARLSALPSAGGETEYLHLDAAALERARKDVRAGRGYRYRTPAHRARIVQEERHHGVAERRFLFMHERKRVVGVGHDPRQPRGIQNAFLEI